MPFENLLTEGIEPHLGNGDDKSALILCEALADKVLLEPFSSLGLCDTDSLGFLLPHRLLLMSSLALRTSFDYQA